MSFSWTASENSGESSFEDPDPVLQEEKSNETMTLSDRHGECIVVPKDRVSEKPLYLSNLVSCTILVLDTVGDVEIANCVHCRIFIAASTGSVEVQGGEDLSITTASQVAIGGYNAAFPNAAEVIGEYRMLTQEESAVARVDSNTTGLQRIDAAWMQNDEAQTVIGLPTALSPAAELAVEAMVDRFDKDGDGLLSFKEFENFLQCVSSPLGSEVLLAPDMKAVFAALGIESDLEAISPYLLKKIYSLQPISRLQSELLLCGFAAAEGPPTSWTIPASVPVAEVAGYDLSGGTLAPYNPFTSEPPPPNKRLHVENILSHLPLALDDEIAHSSTSMSINAVSYKVRGPASSPAEYASSGRKLQKQTNEPEDPANLIEQTEKDLIAALQDDAKYGLLYKRLDLYRVQHASSKRMQAEGRDITSVDLLHVMRALGLKVHHLVSIALIKRWGGRVNVASSKREQESKTQDAAATSLLWDATQGRWWKEWAAIPRTKVFALVRSWREVSKSPGTRIQLQWQSPSKRLKKLLKELDEFALGQIPFCLSRHLSSKLSDPIPSHEIPSVPLRSGKSEALPPILTSAHWDVSGRHIFGAGTGSGPGVDVCLFVQQVLQVVKTSISGPIRDPEGGFDAEQWKSWLQQTVHQLCGESVASTVDVSETSLGLGRWWACWTDLRHLIQSLSLFRACPAAVCASEARMACDAWVRTANGRAAVKRRIIHEVDVNAAEYPLALWDECVKREAKFWRTACKAVLNSPLGNVWLYGQYLHARLTKGDQVPLEQFYSQRFATWSKVPHFKVSPPRLASMKRSENSFADSEGSRRSSIKPVSHKWSLKGRRESTSAGPPQAKEQRLASWLKHKAKDVQRRKKLERQEKKQHQREQKARKAEAEKAYKKWLARYNRGKYRSRDKSVKPRPIPAPYEEVKEQEERWQAPNAAQQTAGLSSPVYIHGVGPVGVLSPTSRINVELGSGWKELYDNV